MRIESLGRETSGKCDLTRKDGIEVWSVRPNGGEVTRVSTQRLPEVLRILTSVPEPTSRASPATNDKPKTQTTT